MPYIKPIDRTQLMICSLDSFVEEKSIARIIDAFVESLNLQEYGVKEASYEGRPAYDPKGMFKLYIYGNRKGIRSSRKLEESCRINIEVKWLIGGVEPDFRTISDFRKNNIGAMKKIFHEFNRRISTRVEWGLVSIDGSKFFANNSKDKNFTKNKLDDRIQWLDAHVEEYLHALEEMDKAEEVEEEANREIRELIKRKLEEKEKRRETYKGYREIMEKKGLSQLSLVDKDARLMKNKNGFAVSYNPQTAVDSNTHLIHNFKMTNQVTDHGMLLKTVKEIKTENEEKIIEAVADKGYQDNEDMIACLENGIIPHVITNEGKEGHLLEISYEESEVDLNSTKPEELRKSLHAGKIPQAYKDVIKDIKVKEVRRMIKEERKDITSSYRNEEEQKARAKEGYFVRDPERNLVYCPAGKVLRQKCIKSNGNIRYANKTACKQCKERNKCYAGKGTWKEIDFTKDQLEKPCKRWMEIEGKEYLEEAKPKKEKKKFKKIKIVQFMLCPDEVKTTQRMCLSEHPFGTIKRAMGATHFLLRGLKKVEGEFALFCLGYNIERAKNLLGFDKLMQAVTTSV